MNSGQEIAASYLSKIVNEFILAQLLEKNLTASIVSVFSDTAKKFPKFAEALLNQVVFTLESDNELENDQNIMMELLLLSARLVDLNGNNVAKQFLKNECNNNNLDISRRAKVLIRMNESQNPSIHNAIWIIKDPPIIQSHLPYMPDY